MLALICQVIAITKAVRGGVGEERWTDSTPRTFKGGRIMCKNCGVPKYSPPFNIWSMLCVFVDLLRPNEVVLFPCAALKNCYQHVTFLSLRSLKRFPSPFPAVGTS